MPGANDSSSSSSAVTQAAAVKRGVAAKVQKRANSILSLARWKVGVIAVAKAEKRVVIVRAIAGQAVVYSALPREPGGTTGHFHTKKRTFGLLRGGSQIICLDAIAPKRLKARHLMGRGRMAYLYQDTVDASPT